MLLPAYPRFLAERESCFNPEISSRSCHIASIAYFPAALASIGIFAREYVAPSGFLVYSTPRSFNKSNTPKTKAETLLLQDAIEYAFTTPCVDSIDAIRSEERRVGKECR